MRQATYSGAVQKNYAAISPGTDFTRLANTQQLNLELFAFIAPCWPGPQKDKNPKDILYIYLIMSKQQTLQSIKSTVGSFLPDAKVLLFGTRARGQATNDTDYDLLIVTNDTFSPQIKMDWKSKIRKALVSALKAPFDVLIASNRELDDKKDLTGHIVQYAVRDGVEI
jgi:predicted nucleotidyltransferase